MEELKVDLRKLNTDDDIKSYYAEVKSIRSSKIDYDKTYIEPSNRPTNLKDKFEQLKRCILKENKEPTTTHDKLKQQLQKVVSHEIKELPAYYSATLQNKFPPKEIDPGSFILPCIIENHSMSNALADLGANPCKSPKGIKENVLVKSSNFVFPVDFIVLDIMEDENVPIILGRPMLATAHAKIDVYGKNISLRVRNDQGIKSLREDGDNLKDFRQISNLEAMFKEFLVLILLFPLYFISLMYNRDIVQIKWGMGVELILDVFAPKDLDYGWTVADSQYLARRNVYIRDLVALSEIRTSRTLLTLMIQFQLLERDKLDLNLLKKGLLVRGEAMKAYKKTNEACLYRIQQLSKCSSEGSGIIPEVPDKPKDISGSSSSSHFLALIMKFKTSPMMRKTKLRKTKLMQKLQRNKLENVQTSLTLSFAELEIQSMVDVPFH
ncbi:retrovirus-related pol polyprotein from transposon TNT 1-94 [Tanacetum coccineum]|uniref:Retrovirus-related pol polyprotein from transposon TNT 1-94 n=1 Tax=Tanacetum coccineum TaxID=301880 RepID=A0ABQ5D6G5_9ASTR